MPEYLRRTVPVLVISILLVACGGNEPTATPIPPATPTTVPANTPLPPTEVPTEAAPPAGAPSATPLPPTEMPTEAAPPTAEPSDTPLPPSPTSEPSPTATPEPTAAATGFLLEGVGFNTPESVLYDPQADVYLVSNINGAPADKDGNGFISRVSPEGQLLDLKWIDGAAEGVTLNAPKGMTLVGQALYVTDIDTVRLFHRNTGAPLATVEIEGARFLNDAAAADDWRVFVTDSALGYVYVISPNGNAARFRDVQLKGPNGIAVVGSHIWVAVGGPVIMELDENGIQVGEVRVPAGALDGLVLLDDGSLIVSSWQSGVVYHIDAAGQATEVATGINGPADIGFDTTRKLVLIPHFDDNRVQAVPLP